MFVRSRDFYNRNIIVERAATQIEKTYRGMLGRRRVSRHKRLACPVQTTNSPLNQLCVLLRVLSSSNGCDGARSRN